MCLRCELRCSMYDTASRHLAYQTPHTSPASRAYHCPDDASESRFMHDDAGKLRFMLYLASSLRFDSEHNPGRDARCASQYGRPPGGHMKRPAAPEAHSGLRGEDRGRPTTRRRRGSAHSAPVGRRRAAPGRDGSPEASAGVATSGACRFGRPAPPTHSPGATPRRAFTDRATGRTILHQTKRSSLAPRLPIYPD